MLCLILTLVYFVMHPSNYCQVWENVFGVNLTAAANADIYNPQELGNQIKTKSNTVKRIGFIGLGAMGFGMATSLLKSNYCVLGFDVIHPFHLLLHIVLNKNTFTSHYLCVVLLDGRYISQR